MRKERESEMESIYQKLCEIVAKDNVLIDENMAKHTSFKVGGNAKYFVLPKDEKELIRKCLK